MSTETLEVQKREERGTAACNKLRAVGRVPANLYGHGEENVNLSVSADAIHTVIKHGTKVLSLTGHISETALLREVQWDTFGIDVLHIDLTRVSTSESVEVTLPVVVHGEAPGSSAGGQLAFPLHEVTIRCPVGVVPDHLDVNIGSLQIGDAIHAGEIALPEGAEVVTPANDVVVQIVKPSGMAATDTEAAEDGQEPEVIGKDKSDGDDES